MRTALLARFMIVGTLLCTAGAWAQQDASPAPEANQPEVPEYARQLRLYLFADNVARGGVPDAEQLKKLVEDHGIQRLICLVGTEQAPEGHQAMVEGQGLAFERTPLGIDPTLPKAEQRIDRAAVTALVERLADTDVKTYVYDQEGLAAAPFVVFAHRILVDKWQFADAVKEAIQTGFAAHEYQGLFQDMKLLASGLDELPQLEPIPFPARNLVAPGEKIEVGGVTLNVKRSGDGPPVYVLHGGPGENHMQFRPFLDPLAKFFEVVYYDQRGCGLSSRPQFAEAYTLDRLAKELDGLRQELGHEKISLIGHSAGGVLALRYALRYPQNVDKLVLVSTWASAEQFAQYIRLMEATLPVETREALVEEFNKFLSQRRNPNDAEITELAKIMTPGSFFKRPTQAFLEDWYPRVNVSALVNDALQTELFRDLDLRDRLTELSGIPTVVVAGKFDLIVPPSVQLTIATTIGGARPVLFDQSGHYPFVEEPEKFLQMVARFLSDGNVLPGEGEEAVEAAPTDEAASAESSPAPALTPAPEGEQ